MTLSLGRLIFIAILLSILAMSGIFAMDVYASLQDVAHQYPSSSSL
jgi:thiol:disulfide interchange protein